MKPRYPVFAYPFRAFFLSLAALAVLAIPAWVLAVTGQWSLPLALPGLFWHQHEMLFGVLSAAIAGFLLTAVCVWTQTNRLHGFPLFGLWLVWLAGRLALAFGGPGFAEWATAINLAFLPLVMADAGWRVVRAHQWRQLPILLVLALLWLMQAGFLLTFDTRYTQGALILALALIGVIGGRITPAFSAGWLRQRGLDPAGVRVHPRLDMASLVSLLLVLVATLAHRPVAQAALALVAAALMLTRLAGWQGWRVRAEPLLWILHLSMLWIPVALVLLAGTALAGWPASAWSHAAGTGAIGAMILGVMARVSLGHTGRPLTLPPGMVTAFVSLHLAALIRVATAFGALPWTPGVTTSAVLWCLAFALFLLRYSIVLVSPRVDGREG
ncbi:NnrS family protein [Marinobacter sp. C2H3]|uniref:NnrS family protein n=1 Tax=Marinobacter sp. C2H3 TaxID=3119003 RepID=UPI00300EDF9F